MDTISKPPLFTIKDGAFQILAACIVQALAIHAGINIAYSTILLPEIMIQPQNETDGVLNSSFFNESLLQNEEVGKLTVNADEASWIASIVTIATPVGALLSGYLADRFGRKLVCALTAIPLAASWFLTAAVSTDVYVMYAARALAGVGGGLSMVSIPYVAETTHVSLRFMLLSLLSAGVSFGILLTVVLGQLMTWQQVAVFNGCLAVANFVSILFIPETPIWLNQKMRLSDNEDVKSRIRHSLKWLYRKSELWQYEFDQLVLGGSQHNKKESDEFSQLNSSLVNKPKYSIYRPVLILFGMFLLQQLSGCYVVIFYASNIFKDIGSLDLRKWVALVSLGVIRFVMSIGSIYVSRFIGRRPLLISSWAGMAASMVAACVGYYFLGPSSFGTVCLLVYITFVSYGVIVLPWSLIGELLPHHFRGRGGGIIISYAYVIMFVTVKLFLLVLDGIGVYVLVVFGVFSLAGVFFVYFFVPETLGKTFDEIACSMKS